MNELVSCILATGNRPNFLRQAIRCFLRQTYDQSELIVIDDGDPPVADLCAGLPRVRYVQLDEPTSLGRKLNMGVQHARGTVIQKLDDDDYYHPDFLKRAVGSLPTTDRARTLVAWDCFLVLLAGDPHLRHSGHGWAVGGTLCFGRELWEGAPFRDVPHDVDPWYATDLSGPFDFVFIDGPSLRHGRQAAFFATAPHLAKRWVVWLHDAARDHEKKCVALWSHYYALGKALSYPEPRGLLKLSALDPLVGPDETPSDLGISILTGGRLRLLQRTLDTLRAQSPGLLEQSVVVALVNGNDPQTRAYLEELPFVDRCLQHNEGILSTGNATSALMQPLLTEGVETILHLEDDWKTETTDPDWLQRAQQILQTYPTVGQIRLRHSSEKVLPYHMVTRQPIRWERHDGFMLSPSAHYTFNPSLIRACNIPKIFPCRSEHEAQVKFLRLGAASAQLLPGVFHHIGVHQRR